MKFLAEYLGHTTLITEYQARTYEPSLLVDLLNTKFSRLGSGHDIVEMEWVTENKAIIDCKHFKGAPNQRVELTLYKH
jgi:hypothetical protein